MSPVSQRNGMRAGIGASAPPVERRLMNRKQQKARVIGLSGLTLLAGTAAACTRPPVPDVGDAAATVDVTVAEGTSMAAAISPDGRTIAIDLQGSIWTLPATGGEATRIMDVFFDARQPVWSPDGESIAFFAHRDDFWDIWTIAPDGTNLRRLTSGPFDDREPAWSHDGRRIAFTSDRGSPVYNSIWILDIPSGEVLQVTNESAHDLMPTWSPDDAEIAFMRRDDSGAQTLWAVTLASGAERRLSSPTEARLDAPSWGPGGSLVYHAYDRRTSRLEVNGAPLTGGENAFPFRVSWASATEFFYTSDGKIRKRDLGGRSPETIEFTATLPVTPARYERRKRDFDSAAPRPVLGIVAPTISPDGSRIAFAALGDIYVMPVGGVPENITRDRFLTTDPAWSPDGTRLVYSSDRAGHQLELWIHDLTTGEDRRLTDLPTQPMGATWSPDGKRIAFLNINDRWRWAEVSVVDVATGQVTKLHDSLYGPGTPTWSRDSNVVALAMLTPNVARVREGPVHPEQGEGFFRAGLNQVMTISLETGEVQWFEPIPQLSIDSRLGAGPVWSPDGTKMAVIYEGLLTIVPVSPTGEPLGPPRRMTAELAHSPSWTADSKHILYQSMDRLKLLDVETAAVQHVPIDLTYTYDLPDRRVVVHAGTLVDGKSPTPRTDVDVVIEGNRIRSVEPHDERLHSDPMFVDAAGLTVMPGLIEWHTHLSKDLGEAVGRAWLAFGITTVRSPGGTPYEAAEDREAVDAGIRTGPRVYASGYLLEWQQARYKMAVAVSSPAHLSLELQRTAALELDLIKSYVRMPTLQQRRIVEFAHEIGIPVATHEIYPAAFAGMDATEHTAGTSSRGYSAKIGTLQQSYADVAQIFGKAGMVFSPMVSGRGLRCLLQMDPELSRDPRFDLYPEWVRRRLPTPGRDEADACDAESGGTADMILNAKAAGARIVVGTDRSNGVNVHGMLMTLVLDGMTPFEAIQAATVTPAEALGLDAGSIEPGKLADLVIIDGNPLEDISATLDVELVIANGRVYRKKDLLMGAGGSLSPEAVP